MSFYILSSIFQPAPLAKLAEEYPPFNWCW